MYDFQEPQDDSSEPRFDRPSFEEALSAQLKCYRWDGQQWKLKGDWWYNPIWRSPYALHDELADHVHDDCTVFTCDKMRMYRNALNALGHDHPKAECPKCAISFALTGA
jgi:hypothetical protein